MLLCHVSCLRPTHVSQSGLRHARSTEAAALWSLRAYRSSVFGTLARGAVACAGGGVRAGRTQFENHCAVVVLSDDHRVGASQLDPWKKVRPSPWWKVRPSPCSACVLASPPPEQFIHCDLLGLDCETEGDRIAIFFAGARNDRAQRLSIFALWPEAVAVSQGPPDPRPQVPYWDEGADAWT